MAKMDTASIEAKVAAHYTRGDLTDRIVTALELQNAASGSVQVDALYPVDQLHHGGVGLTERMAEVAGIVHAMRVLDSGSGIGGSSRFLVDRFACAVDAIDLSEEFVRTAENLDRLVGLSDRITHCVGSVTALPYDDGTFDAVWAQNVTMNAPDKRAMFAEAWRVLRPGGVYVLSHIGAGAGGVIDYPVPWAMTAETSFVMSPGELLQTLVDIGFEDIEDHQARAPIASPPPAQNDQPDDSVAMGDDMPRRRANSARAIADGRLIPMMITARHQ